MKALFNIISFLALLAFAEGCNPEEPIPKPPLTELEKLPPATQEGKDTFGCLVNGKAWRTFSSTNTTSHYQSGNLQIAGVVDVPLQSIGINISDAIGSVLFVGKYSLVNPSPHNPTVRFYNPPACNYDSSGNPERAIEGELTITHFDKSGFIVSGLFHFTLVMQSCEPDTIKITDGRFDIRYSP